jgi:hypothetical protein
MSNTKSANLTIKNAEGLQLDDTPCGIIILWLGLLTACSTGKVSVVNHANIPVVYTHVFSPQSGISILGGSLHRTSDNEFVVAGGSDFAYRRMHMYKSTGYGTANVVWRMVQIFEDDSVWLCASHMTAVGATLYFSIVTGGHKSGSLYQSRIYKSIDNGESWQLFVTNTRYQIMLSGVRDHRGRIAVLLSEVPLTGWHLGNVNFGWLNPRSGRIETVSRMASMNDEPNSFPNETTFYRRSDGAIVALIRWGEAPHIPFVQPRISYDEGRTWRTFGPRWPGYAGQVSVCHNALGQLWAGGYHKVADYTAYTAIWQVNPETAEIIGTKYPFTQVAPLQVGNGQIYCDGLSANIYAAENNGVLHFAEILVE